MFVKIFFFSCIEALKTLTRTRSYYFSFHYLFDSHWLDFLFTTHTKGNTGKCSAIKKFLEQINLFHQLRRILYNYLFFKTYLVTKLKIIYENNSRHPYTSPHSYHPKLAAKLHSVKDCQLLSPPFNIPRKFFIFLFTCEHMLFWARKLCFFFTFPVFSLPRHQNNDK